MSKRKSQRKARSGRSASKRTARRSTKRAARGRGGKTARASRGAAAGRTRAARRLAAKRRTTRRPVAATRRRGAEEDRGETGSLARELAEYTATGPVASAGDLDADWQRAESSGEETVGGSVATPDQDVVDEIGHALGVEQPSQAPLRSSEEILEDRDRRYWELERRARRKADRRREP
ncbi:MAG TPA: DUF6335 family protein [Methylomirabilota bacterium]|nr:DUF6335 family protein [Methylomirabilota bacterium]